MAAAYAVSLARAPALFSKGAGSTRLTMQIHHLRRHARAVAEIVPAVAVTHHVTEARQVTELMNIRKRGWYNEDNWNQLQSAQG